jgi:hypothetical protein
MQLASTASISLPGGIYLRFGRFFTLTELSRTALDSRLLGANAILSLIGIATVISSFISFTGGAAISDRTLSQQTPEHHAKPELGTEQPPTFANWIIQTIWIIHTMCSALADSQESKLDEETTRPAPNDNTPRENGESQMTWAGRCKGREALKHGEVHVDSNLVCDVVVRDDLRRNSNRSRKEDTAPLQQVRINSEDSVDQDSSCTRVEEEVNAPMLTVRMNKNRLIEESGTGGDGSGRLVDSGAGRSGSSSDREREKYVPGNRNERARKGQSDMTESDHGEKRDIDESEDGEEKKRAVQGESPVTAILPHRGRNSRDCRGLNFNCALHRDEYFPDPLSSSEMGIT